MKQWKSLVALHSSAHSSCFPHPPSTPSPCPSPPRELAEEKQQQQQQAVRLVGCDGQVLTFRRPVTARELMQQHPQHLVCRSDALLIGEKIPAVAPADELQPGQAYFLLPDHLFHSVLSFVSLASSLLLLLSTAPASLAPGAKNKKQPRPFELHRTDSGTLQIKFSDDFLVGDDATQAAEKPAVLRGDERLEKEYEELVGYGKALRWAPKLETIQEVLVTAAPSAQGRDRRKGMKVMPFLAKLGSRRRRETTTTTTTIICGNDNAVACSG
ncbi:uncharacterized protein LOC124687893 [Lolium rigidum]|uniref:uncharacterized protein LOC124687893 n=1 Tax=Lolium rigidum TaxID=89674 RepID=UPI001F5C0BF4|nr:uncharacterized protein LOC124687893 [Lolium rigidum]